MIGKKGLNIAAIALHSYILILHDIHAPVRCNNIRIILFANSKLVCSAKSNGDAKNRYHIIQIEKFIFHFILKYSKVQLFLIKRLFYSEDQLGDYR